MNKERFLEILIDRLNRVEQAINSAVVNKDHTSVAILDIRRKELSTVIKYAHGLFVEPPTEHTKQEMEEGVYLCQNTTGCVSASICAHAKTHTKNPGCSVGCGGHGDKRVEGPTCMRIN